MWWADCIKEYVTVSQLNQLFGMPKVDPSPTSSVQSFQAIVADPVHSSHTSQCGSSQSLPVEVCVISWCRCVHDCIYHSSGLSMWNLSWINWDFELLVLRHLFLHFQNQNTTSYFQCMSLLSFLPVSIFPLFPTYPPFTWTALQTQPAWSRLSIPRLDSERWYQEIMAAGESSHACPPPLPAKCLSSRKPMQVNSLHLSFFYSACIFCLSLSSLSFWLNLSRNNH